MVLNAISTMSKSEIIENKEYLLRILKIYYYNFYQTDSRFAQKFRKTICWVDEALFMLK